MSATGTAPKRSPYKFLDYYEADDRPIFFGRERETQTLVSDVIATRIVVLFAKTGTGKTSLINAGVRPRLHDLDYGTLHIRVERDPASSVRTELRKRKLLPNRPAEQAVAPALRAAAERLQRPIVVFFDQFEEFFIYMRDQNDERRARDFIANVAELYRDPESGVHTVFSMREEYFVEMDAFRDEIPSIFHNDSSLRLRPLDQDQARRAIKLPAREVGGEVDDELVAAMISDLAEHGQIEPARLQIVCDTLWSEARDGRIGMAVYRRLGGAARILERRLAEDFGGLEDRQLAILERLLPQLRTEFKTKYTRGVEELVERLETDRSSLDDLIDKLYALRLLRKTTINRALYVEWTSDYLAEQTNALQEIVRATTLRRLLAADVRRAGLVDPGPGADGVLSLLHLRPDGGPTSPTLLPSREDLDSLSEGASLLGELDRTEATFLLIASLAHGAHMRQWFDAASGRGAEIWGLLRTVLTRGGLQEKAVRNAVRLLGELRSPTAMDLLEVAVRQPMSATAALRVLEEMHTGPAVELLTKVVREAELASDAIDALRRMGKAEAVDALATVARTGDATALRAGSALSLLAGGPAKWTVTDHAKAALEDVLGQQAETLFLVALRHGLELRFWFERAQEHRVDVWKVLRESVTNENTPIEQAKGALRLLFELPEERARELIELAKRDERLADTADRALSTREALEAIRRGPPTPADKETSGIDPVTWTLLLNKINKGHCVPVLGAATSIGPRLEEIAEKWSFKYELPASDPGDLALVSQLLATRTDWEYVRMELAGELRRTQPSDVHGGLAELPLSVYMTTSYDNSMEEALSAQGKSPQSVVIPPSWSPNLPEADFNPSPGHPLVFHLTGSVHAPDSLVLTEDDYLRLLVQLVGEHNIVPIAVQAAMARSMVLLLGLRPRGWPFRVLRHGLIDRLPGMRPRTDLATLLSPGGSSTGPAAYDPVEYLSDYFAQMGVRVYWGDPGSFMTELRQRWRAHVPA